MIILNLIVIYGAVGLVYYFQGCYNKNSEMPHNQTRANHIFNFIRKVIIADLIINIGAGTLCTFFPRLLNILLFGSLVFPWWVISVIGAGFYLFAAWQLLYFLRKGGFTSENFRFAAVLAWIPFLGLTAGLISDFGDPLLDLPKILLWLANIYMLLLGGLYWVTAVKIVGNQQSNPE